MDKPTDSKAEKIHTRRTSDIDLLAGDNSSDECLSIENYLDVADDADEKISCVSTYA